MNATLLLISSPPSASDAPTGAALPAPQLGRQTFRAHDADVAALLAGDLEHHGRCTQKNSPGKHRG